MSTNLLKSAKFVAQHRGLRWLVIAVACLVFGWLPSTVSAQVYRYLPGHRYVPVYRYGPGYRVHWSAYDPYYAVTNRVFAQADMIRAQGDAAVSYSVARNLNAEAYSKELDNWTKQIRTYWDGRITAEEKKVELNKAKRIRQIDYLNDRRFRKNLVWQGLLESSDLTESKIESGEALNFLLERLDSILPYQFDPGSSRFDSDALSQLRLDKELLGHITLEQGSFRFVADRPVDGRINDWPYILRFPEFDERRQAYEAARVRVVEEAEEDGKATVDAIQSLHQAHMALTNEFHRSKDVKDWVEENHRFNRFNESDRFLRELDREIMQLEQEGDLRPFTTGTGYDPAVDGDNVISFLCYISRNGLQFAPAAAGDKPAYHQMFTMMRAVYLTVADQDPTLQPLNAEPFTN